MRKFIRCAVLFTLINMLCYIRSYTQNIFPASGNVGIGTSSPTAHLEVYEPAADSKPGGVVAPTKSVLKLSRIGTPNYSYNEAAEFRIGHGGPDVWGSQLDLYINGATNTSNIPDQQVMTWLYSGKVGIGTTKPVGVLDVGALINNGALGSALARQTEGNTSGDGTFLGVRAWETAISTYQGKSFSLEHDFYGHVNSAINFYRGDSQTGGYMTFATNNGSEQMRIDPSGNVGIGTTNPQTKLAVNGMIQAQEVKVTTATSDWPDYVFNPSYQLTPIDSLSAQIHSLGHLPDIPSAIDIDNKGQNLGEMNKKLLQKVEELTLYLIEQQKQIDTLKTEIKQLIN